MILLNIVSTKSLRAGLEDVTPVECPLCGCKTMCASYIDLLCDTCGFSPERANSMGDARKRYCKEKDIKRPVWSMMMGVKTKTVSNYECIFPSSIYFEKCKNILSQHYGD